MTRLLDDRYAPITSEIGFLESDTEALVARYLEWHAWIERSREKEWLNVERAISALKDGDRWRFETVGEPLPFEDVDRYREREVRKRFPHELLDRYLRELGIRAFEEAFYAPQGWSILLTSRRPRDRDVQEKTLEQARVELDVPPATALPGGAETLLDRLRAFFRR